MKANGDPASEAGARAPDQSGEFSLGCGAIPVVATKIPSAFFSA